MKRILVTGGTGQIGSELVPALRQKYGSDNVVCGGHRRNPDPELAEGGPYEVVNVANADEYVDVVKKYGINVIYHLPAILSAKAEENPMGAWHVNVTGLINALEIAREYKCSLFVPSSIAAFGPSSPKWKTPQDTIQRPQTMYGVTKVTGELLCDYYFLKYGVDARGVRYPGLISYKTLPGGGTTDYAVEIFYEALKNKKYTCYLKKDTRMDMMYMPDALKAAIDLMEADPSKLVHRNAFNITAMAFTPEELVLEIKKHIPEFEIYYDVDPVKQGIADSWPDMLDDSCARQEWGWNPEYDLPTMVKDMLEKLSKKLGIDYK